MNGKRCIITAAIPGGHGWYEQGVQRLQKSLKLVGYTDRLLIAREYPAGCPTNEKARKAFKPWLINQVYEEGYTQIFWLDSSVWAIRPLDPMWADLEKRGWYLINQPEWNTGQWTCDAALEGLGITREESWDIWQLASGFVGLNLENDRAKIFLSEWYRMAKEEKAFAGPRWAPLQKGRGIGTVGFCSHDERVLGHRADQTAASVISWKLNMQPINRRQSHLAWRGPQAPELFTTESQKCMLVRGGPQPGDLKGIPYS